MYQLNFSEKGGSSFAALDKKIAQSIFRKLKRLVQNADQIMHLPLEGNLTGLYKLKVGDWRVLYEINHEERIITVHKAGHRRDIYR